MPTRPILYASSCLHGVAEHAHLDSPPEADDARQEERYPGVGHQPDLDEGNRELRALRGDPQVARERYPHPGPVDRAVQGGDYWFFGRDHPFYEPAVTTTQVFPEVGVSVRALYDLRQVGARGEALPLTT